MIFESGSLIVSVELSMQSFGWNLLQFARSVDSLDEGIIVEMKEVIRDYVQCR